MNSVVGTWAQNLVGTGVAIGSLALAVRFVISFKSEPSRLTSDISDSLIRPRNFNELFGSLLFEMLLLGLTAALAGDLWFNYQHVLSGTQDGAPHGALFQTLVGACVLCATDFGVFLLLLFGFALDWGNNVAIYERRGRRMCGVSALIAALTGLVACLCAPTAAFLGAVFFLYCAGGGVPRGLERAIHELVGENERYPRVAYGMVSFVFFAIGCVAVSLDYPGSASP